MLPSNVQAGQSYLYWETTEKFKVTTDSWDGKTKAWNVTWDGGHPGPKQVKSASLRCKWEDHEEYLADQRVESEFGFEFGYQQGALTHAFDWAVEAHDDLLGFQRDSLGRKGYPFAFNLSDLQRLVDRTGLPMPQTKLYRGAQAISPADVERFGRRLAALRPARLLEVLETFAERSPTLVVATGITDDYAKGWQVAKVWAETSQAPASPGTIATQITIVFMDEGDVQVGTAWRSLQATHLPHAGDLFNFDGPSIGGQVEDVSWNQDLTEAVVAVFITLKAEMLETDWTTDVEASGFEVHDFRAPA